MNIRKTVNIGILLVAVTGTFALASGILALGIEGEIGTSILTIVSVAGFVGGLLSLELGLYVLVVLSLTEGIYKTIMPSFFTLALKDFVLVTLLVRLFYMSLRRRDFSWLSQQITTPAILFIGYATAMGAAPTTHSIAVALAGLRSWVMWFPVYYPAYAAMKTRRQIIRLLKAVVCVSIPTSLYGIIQNVIGFEHLSALPRVASHISRYGERAFSIFNAPATFAIFSAIATLIAISLALRASSHMERLLMFGAAGMGLGGVIASGSRAPLLGLAFGAIIMLLLIRRKGIMIAVAAVVGILSIFYVIPHVTAGYDRIASFTSQRIVVRRILTPWEKGYRQGMKHPLGRGIASGQGVGRVFRGQFEKEKFQFIENEFGRCFAQLGFPGLFFWLWLLWSAFRQAFVAVRSVHDFEDHAILTGIFGVLCLVGVQLLGGSALYGIGGIYFWIISAFTLRYTELSSQTAQENTAAQETAAEAPA